MSLSAVVDVAVFLDHLEVYSQKLQGSLRLAISLHRKKEAANLFDKLQTKRELATPFITADRGTEELSSDCIYKQELNEGELLQLYKADPYVLTDSFFPKISTVPGAEQQGIRKTAYFRIELPSYPFHWKDSVFLRADLLMKQQVFMVERGDQFGGGGAKFEQFDDQFVRIASQTVTVSDPIAGRQSSPRET